MRSLTFEASLVALPSLAANASAVYWGEALRAAAAGSWYASPPFFVVSCCLFGFASSWLLYRIAGQWLEHRPLAIGAGGTMLLFMTGLIAALGLIYFPTFALGLATSAIGSVFALKVLRSRPSSRRSGHAHEERKA